MNRRTAFAAALGSLALILPLTGCGADETPMADVTSAASAPANGAELNATEFAAAVLRTGTVVLDVRTPAEYAEGHLPRAVNVDVESADFVTRLETLDKTVPYALYCRSGNRSGTALSMMTAAGFTSTYHLGGGIGAWSAAGGEVTTG